MGTNREVFDRMAPTWYGVRHWPLLQHELESMARRWEHGKLANLGCGHGADFLPFRHGFELTGLDHSQGMLHQARRYMARHGFRAALVCADLCHLPFADNSFDCAVAVAGYHHIETKDGRRHALDELCRVLRPGGEAFISVWNREQPRFRDTPSDQWIPWRDGEVTLYRFYHLFTAEELASVLQQSGFAVAHIGPGTLRTDAATEDVRNICALIQKPTS